MQQQRQQDSNMIAASTAPTPAPAPATANISILLPATTPVSAVGLEAVRSGVAAADRQAPLLKVWWLAPRAQPAVKSTNIGRARGWAHTAGAMQPAVALQPKAQCGCACGWVPAIGDVLGGQ
eukprot:358162-Chlamydomonas_euryale.AAC.12